MNLLVPVQCDNEIEGLIENGINEFYCGYVPQYWIKKYNKTHGNCLTSMQVSINRRDNIFSNVTDLNSLKRMCTIIEKNGGTLFVTLNMPYYPEEAYPDICIFLEELSEAGVQHLIVSDIGIIKYIQENYSGFRLSISCENQVINSYSVKFYASFENVERIVLPRHITIKELDGIVKQNSNMDFECFILSNKCIYDDGNCHCIHDLGLICQDRWDYEICGDYVDYKDIIQLSHMKCNYEGWSFNYNDMTQERSMLFWRKYGCSLCALYNLVKYKNLKSLKIVGRGRWVEFEDIRFLKQLIQYAENGADLKDLKKSAKELYKNSALCDSGKYCIMPGAII